MIWAIRIIGIVIIIIAGKFLLHPQSARNVMGFFAEGKRVYIAGTGRFIVGVFLLIASTYCNRTAVIIVLGSLLVIAGAALFIIPIEIIHKNIERLRGKSDITLRALLLIPVIMGAVLIWAA